MKHSSAQHAHTKLPKVTIGLILFKGEKYLQSSLPTLVNQDYTNVEYLFRDQSPNGEAYQFIKENLPEVLKKVQFEQGENLMHSGGHNVLMRKMAGEYYFCCSYDMLYPSDLISKMIEILEKSENQKYGSVTCKSKRWDFQENPESKGLNDSVELGKTNIFDSTGISLNQSHYFFEIGQGEIDKGQYDHLKDIFGASGAFTVFRKSALEDISYTNKNGLKEYYDELIHYKNDVDMAYRLQWAGYPCLFVPELTVYHDRQVAAKNVHDSVMVTSLKSRGDKSNWAKESSFLGHMIVLEKNFKHQPFSWKVRFKTALTNFLRIGYIMIFERYLLKQSKVMKVHEAEIKAKTKAMLRRVKPAVIEKLMR